MARRSGRAPNCGSNPRSASQLTASGVNSTSMPWARSRRRVSLSNRSVIRSSWVVSSCWNTTISSIRLRNSGRNASCRRRITWSRRSALAASAVLLPNPSGPRRPTMSSDPRLLVMMITVLRKSTVRPCESVSRPSSSTCNRVLKTSGWAFSISSKSTTEYGRRRTASGELTGVLVADVPGWGADQPADGVPLLELRHVEPDHPVLVAEQGLGEGPRQLGLAYAGRSQEEEAADRPVQVAEADTGAAHRFGDDLDRLVLPDPPVVQALLQVQQPRHLLLRELADRDAGGPGHHLGDVLDADLGNARTLAAAVPRLLEPPLRLGELVAQLRGPLLLLARDRQVPVGDVAIGQLHGRDDGLVGEPDLVVRLIAVAQPAEDLHGVLDAGLGHQDRLEPALQRGVLLDVAAVLVQGRGTNDVQVPAGQGRLEHGAGTAGALGGAGPDDRVELVDEGDDLVAVLADLVDDLLQPLLEVAAVAGAGDQAGQVELHHPTAAEGLRHVALGDLRGNA